ncbi:hypothetical protein B6U67_00755 [Methanosarcinales archaeon ex4484_138]|nr:MAG: hypothetical protein B6U67_00755 [Methanosarcinales archaeon ex4484_138]
MKFNPFEQNVIEGEICEEKVKERFKEIFTPILHHILFNDNPELQKRGIDFEIHGRPVRFDVKCRFFKSYSYGDILLETVSVREEDKPGWLWTSESDIIVYVWQNKQKNKFIGGYLLFLNEIRDWLDKTGTSRFRKIIAHSINRHGSQWSTENIAVPISEFPAHCIKKIELSDFSPADQAKLDKWFE